MELLSQPWPWWAAGIIIGLTVPALLMLGNKHFGISANLRHICAACVPANIKFFQYEWKKEVWNFFFVGGILFGSVAATLWFQNPEPVQIHPQLAADLGEKGIANIEGLVPEDLFSWK
ncbi:MAG TPA: YeeE/YedE family protein, partial [Saprospiraceae bacterium]|nr:YeeE/YedE family protein [Saprospiraceae bacterium]